MNPPWVFRTSGPNVADVASVSASTRSIERSSRCPPNDDRRRLRNSVPPTAVQRIADAVTHPLMSSIVPPDLPDILVIAVGLPLPATESPTERRDPTARRTTSPQRYRTHVRLRPQPPLQSSAGSLRTRCRSIFGGGHLPKVPAVHSRSSFRPAYGGRHHVDVHPR